MTEDKKKMIQEYYEAIAKYNKKQREIMTAQSELRILKIALDDLHRRLKENGDA